jgi:hypothetical protein
MYKDSIVRLMIRVFLVFSLTATVAVPAYSEQVWRAQNGVVVVGADRGGLMRDRANYVETLRRAGLRVEIRGAHCMSSCTMFLGAGDVCVNPRTVFGFHGPSDYGRRLPPDQFEYWSNVMSRHYPPQMRRTYMHTWRYHIKSYVSMTGSELVRLGFNACKDRTPA